MIVYKYISLSRHHERSVLLVLTRCSDTPGTSVQPDWLAENVSPPPPPLSQRPGVKSLVPSSLFQCQGPHEGRQKQQPL